MSRMPLPLRFALILAIGIVVGVGFSIGRTVEAEVKPIKSAQADMHLADSEATAEKRSQTIPWRDARLLAEVLEHVRQEYVENIPDDKLIAAAIRGMIADLDPHSAFLDPNE